MTIEGIILAGGQSRRFGSDKALAEFRGRKMIEAPAQMLKKLGLPVTVIAPSSRDYSFLNCRVEPDLIAGLGPISGLHAAFSIYPEADLLVLTCDMPLVSESLLRDLLTADQSEYQAVVYQMSMGELAPFPGLYRRSLFAMVQNRIAQNDYSMYGFLNQVARIKKIALKNQDQEFTNVNQPSEAGDGSHCLKENECE